MSGRNIPGGYETWTKEDELRKELAERNLVVEQLQMALNVRDTQLAAVTADRDAAVSALRLTRAAQGQHTGVFMRLDAYQDLLSQIAALEEQVKAPRVRA